MGNNAFDPENVTKDEMKRLAEHIESYLNLLEAVMIIPQDIQQEHGKTIKSAIERSRKLVKKLRKGDRSVFKDPQDNDR